VAGLLYIYAYLIVVVNRNNRNDESMDTISEISFTVYELGIQNLMMPIPFVLQPYTDAGSSPEDSPIRTSHA
jgi:hypothetical protein